MSTRTTRTTDDRSVGRLVEDMTSQSSDLLRKELALAQLELKEKGRKAGLGAGMFGGAGVLGAYLVGTLIAAAILGLSTAVDAWLAALIVSAVLAVAAGLLALTGRREVTQATPPVPEDAVDSTKEDIAWMKQRAHR
jgi:MFS family permease